MVWPTPESKGGREMLVISESAAEAIRGLIAGPEVPQGAGLRIVAQPAAGGENVGLELAVAAAPAEDDAVVEEQGAQVFLEPQAAEPRPPSGKGSLGPAERSDHDLPDRPPRAACLAGGRPRREPPRPPGVCRRPAAVRRNRRRRPRPRPAARGPRPAQAQRA